MLFSSALLVPLVGVAACAPSPDPSDLHPEVRTYLDEALQVMQEQALYTREIDWDAVRTSTFERAAGAVSTPAAYPALRYALSQLRDGHSFLQLSEELRSAEREALGEAPLFDAPNAGERPPLPFGARMEPESGVEALPGQGRQLAARVFMPQGMRDDSLATTFQQMIEQLDAQDPCGWIVDLRGNGGGNMWPMLAGLGPLLGEGVVGGSVEAGGARALWAYEEGVSIYVNENRDREPVNRTLAEPFVLTGAPPIAVLIDRGTASSGESLALAFRGRPETRLFGERSYGASTATEGFKLSDGANLVIATAVFTDRDGRAFPDGVAPDVELPPALEGQMPPPAVDPAIQAALAWLAARAECAAE